MTTRIAVYAGSFDPITYGHVDVARRGAQLFDKVILAVGENPKKRYLLDFDERKSVVKESIADIENAIVDNCYPRRTPQ